MKYQNLSAFVKHLEQAAKVDLSRVFLVVSSCPYERKKIVLRIVAAIRLKEHVLHLHREDGAHRSVGEWIDELNTASLLSGKQVVYLDEIDKQKKNGLVLLAEYIARPSPFAYLLLGASSSKSLGDLYTKGKKELIVCDLSDEKPWDRKERFKRSLIEDGVKAGKRLHSDAADYLVENVGLQLAALEQELAKLITYIAERSELTLQDVQLLCTPQKNSSVWQIAEEIVWKEGLSKVEEIGDLSMLLPLLSQLRSQLQQGLVLAILMERGATQGEITHHLPTVRPAALSKMAAVVQVRKSPFFKRALDLLFEIELMAKNSSFEPGLILDLALTKLALLKKNQTDSYVVPVS